MKDWILSAVSRSVAISSGQLKRLPWEEVLWGDEPLPKFGSTVDVPESLLLHGRNARVVIARIAGEWTPGRTLAAMQQDVLKHQKDILETDRSAALEIGFLVQQVHVVADTWAQEELLQALKSVARPN